MRMIKKYWFYIAFACAVVAGVVFADWSFNRIVEPSSPYMIVDKSEPSDYSPVGYEPVEMTGLAVGNGEKVMVSCSVPESYAPYIHYPNNWNNNVMNPEAWQGQTVKWGLFGVLGLLICFIAWRTIVIIKKKQRSKTIWND